MFEAARARISMIRGRRSVCLELQLGAALRYPLDYIIDGGART